MAPGWQQAEHSLRSWRNDAFSGYRSVLFGVALLLLVSAAPAAAAADAEETGRIHSGVAVAGVGVGGKSPEAALSQLEKAGWGSLPESITFVGAGDGGSRDGSTGELTLDTQEIGASLSLNAAVDEAYAVGREGNLLERLWQRAAAALGRTEIELRVEYDRAAAEEAVGSLVQDMDPQDAAVHVEEDEIEVREARQGYRPDQAAMLANLHDALQNRQEEADVVGERIEPEVGTSAARTAAEEARMALEQPLVLAADEERWTIEPEDMGHMISFESNGSRIEPGVDAEQLRQVAAEAYSELESEPESASFEVSGGSVEVLPDRAGRQVEERELVDRLEAGLFEGQHEFQIPLLTTEPELTAEEARELAPTDLIGEYRTNYLTYDDTPGRVTNLQRSSEAVDGTLLAPGEVFSFNELAEPLEYEPAAVIVGGAVDYADGGGLCQVSSTLYMAAVQAGAEVVERHPHFAELAYIQPGLDATVWFGSGVGDDLDMSFRNTTDGYLLLQQRVTDDGYVTAEVYGQPTATEIELDSEQVYSGADAQGDPITEWVTYRTETENGSPVSSEVVHRDTYGALAG